MNYPEKKIAIAVFDNEYRSADNHPIKNVVVTLPDGTKLEGGLWNSTSKNGLEYMYGVLIPASEKAKYSRKTPTRSAKQEPEVDFG
jgi:hypothetical protein